MGKINTHELSPKVREINHRRLFQILQERGFDEVSFVTRKILSPSEVEMVSKRIAIAVLLEAGADYKGIQDILKVSKMNIAKVNNLYRYDTEFREIIKKFVKEEFRPKKRGGYTLTQAAKDLGLVLRLAAQIH